MAVNSSTLPRPILRKKVVEIPEMGGEIVLQALRLEDAIDLGTMAREDGRGRQITRMLHLCVVNPDGTPFWTEDEWGAYGSAPDGMRVCVRLANEVERMLSGTDVPVEKKELMETAVLQ